MSPAAITLGIILATAATAWVLSAVYNGLRYRAALRRRVRLIAKEIDVAFGRDNPNG